MIRAARYVLTAAILCAALAGCSSGNDESTAQVASASSPKAGPSAPATSAPAGSQTGAMVSMSMTEEEKEVVHRAYYSCLKSHGAKMMIKGGYEMPDLEAGEKPAEAFQACASKKPYLDPKYTKEGNPKYAEQTLAWMACMNREGVEVSGNWDDDFFKFGKVRPGTDRQNVDRKCYIESYR